MNICDIFIRGDHVNTRNTSPRLGTIAASLTLVLLLCRTNSLYAPIVFDPAKTVDHMKELRDRTEQKEALHPEEVRRLIGSQEQHRQEYIRQLDVMQQEAQRARTENQMNKTAVMLLDAFRQRPSVEISVEQRSAALPLIAKSAEIFEANRDIMLKNIKENPALMPQFLGALEGGMRVLREYAGVSGQGRASITRELQAGKALNTFLSLAGDVARNPELSPVNRQKIADTIFSGIFVEVERGSGKREIPILTALQRAQEIDGRDPRVNDLAATMRTMGDAARLLRDPAVEMTKEKAQKYADLMLKTLEIAKKHSEQMNEDKDQAAKDFNDARASLMQLTPEMARYLDTPTLQKFLDARFSYFKDATNAEIWAEDLKAIDSIKQIIELTSRRPIEDRITILMEVQKQIDAMRDAPKKPAGNAERALKAMENLASLEKAAQGTLLYIPKEKMRELLRDKKGIDAFKELAQKSFKANDILYLQAMANAVEALGGDSKAAQRVLLDGKAGKELKAEDVKKLLEMLEKIEKATSAEEYFAGKEKLQQLEKTINTLWKEFPREELLGGFIEKGRSEDSLRFIYLWVAQDSNRTLQLIDTVFKKYGSEKNMQETLDVIALLLLTDPVAESDRINNIDEKTKLALLFKATDLFDAERITRITNNNFEQNADAASAKMLVAPAVLKIQETAKNLKIPQVNVFQASFTLLKNIDQALKSNKIPAEKLVGIESNAQNILKFLVSGPKGEGLAEGILAYAKPQEITELLKISSVIFTLDDAAQIYHKRGPDTPAKNLNYRLARAEERNGGWINVVMNDLLLSVLQKKVSLTQENIKTLKDTILKRRSTLKEEQPGQRQTTQEGIDNLVARINLVEKLQSGKINELQAETIQKAFQDLQDKHFDLFVDRTLDALGKNPPKEILASLAEATRKNLEPVKQNEEMRKQLTDLGFLAKREESLKKVLSKQLAEYDKLSDPERGKILESLDLLPKETGRELLQKAQSGNQKIKKIFEEEKLLNKYESEKAKATKKGESFDVIFTPEMEAKMKEAQGAAERLGDLGSVD